MGETHKVRFEPVGIDIEVDEDETVLNAAFRQGVMLMHGCKEGQCSACKSFLLDGDVQMDRYSTFALADYESEEGYVLLCRSHAYSDLEVELINYDEDMIRSGLPVISAWTTVESIAELTHDITALTLRLNGERPAVPPRAVRGHLDPGHRGAPVVLDGQHLLCRRPARLHREAVPGREVLRAARGRAEGRRPAGDHRAVRRVHAAGQLRPQAGVRRRRGRHGADPVAAAPDGGERQRAGGRVLLRRPRRGRPHAARRDGRDRAAAAQVPFRAMPFPRVAGELAGGDRHGHRGAGEAARRTSPSATSTCAGRRR